MPPTVSIIIPTHNRSDLLPRAIRSVLNQTYPDIECIVVDDASTDGTPGLLQRMAADEPRLSYYRHEQSRYAGGARNTGIKHAKGDFIAFLDDDDIYLPEKIERQLALAEQFPDDHGLVYCWMDYFTPDGTMVNTCRPTIEGDVFADVIDRQRIGGCPTWLLKREAVESVGGFDEQLPRGNDGDFIRRVCQRWKVKCLPETLVHVFVDHGHGRISDLNERGTRHAILGESVKLTKFADQLTAMPRHRATIHQRIAEHHMRLREFAPAASHHLQALKAQPLCPQTYKHIAKGIRAAWQGVAT